MKKIAGLCLSLAVVASFTSCDNYNKKKTEAKLEGTWQVTNLVLPVNGKDSSFKSATNGIDLRFDACDETSVTDGKCNLSFIIKEGGAYNDKYIPLGYKLEGKDKLTLMFGDTVYFKIEELKKDALKLTGTDSTFSGTTNYIIEAK